MCERNINKAASHMSPSGDLAPNPLGMCPDQNSNWQLLGSQASVPSTEPYTSQGKNVRSFEQVAKNLFSSNISTKFP